MATAFYGGNFFGGEFFSSTGGTPVVVTPTARPGVKRSWALKRDKKLYYFDSLREMRAFQDAQSEIVVPPETIREAKKLGYKTIKLEAERRNYDLLAQIEREIEAKRALERVDEAIAKAQLSARLLDQQDEDDFREFIKFLNS